MWRKRLTVYPWGLLESNVYVETDDEHRDMYETADDEDRDQGRPLTGGSYTA